MALTSKLENIGNAIRNKTGKTDKLTLDEMATEIASITTGEGGGYEIPEEALVQSGDCQQRFYSGESSKAGYWDWFLNMCADKITTEKITSTNYMFAYCKSITRLPFDFNFQGTQYWNSSSMFQHCHSLKEIGKIKNMYPTNINNMFENCKELRYLPEFENLKMDYIYGYAYSNISRMFYECMSLREIPESLLKQLYTPISTANSYSIFSYGFTGCYALDEIRGLNPQTGVITTNMFNSAFNTCNRLKDVIFVTQDDGTPYTVSWKSQTMDLSNYVGWTSNEGYITTHNSGITTDKKVNDDVTYQALKDDPDWFTTKIAYSRYNKESALRTIQSLPDTSAYLATQSGATNTIKFAGNAGSSTDGGAINTLTESQIAVATAKGWTVSLV